MSSRRRRLFLLTPLTWAVPAIFGRPVRGQARNAIETQTSAPSSQPEPYLTSDSGIGGPNAYSMVDGLNLPWPSRTPWIDADGIAGGTKPYASHNFAVGERHALPITPLVRKLRANENRGFCFRNRSDFAMNLAGRLAEDTRARPVLSVKTNSGDFVVPCNYFTRYYPNPDQSVAIADCRPVVGIPPNTLGLAHFDLSRISGDIIDATLALSCIAIDTAKTVPLEIFELDAPRIFIGNGGEEPRLGVADRYPFDAGLAADPAVLFVGNFKNANDPGWHYGMHGQQAKIGYDASVESYFYEGAIGPGGNFAQDAQVWLDGIVIDGGHGGRPKLPAWHELYMRMYVHLNADFFSSRMTSWKMPGIGQAHGVWIPYPRDPRFSLGGYWDTGSTSGRGPITEGFGTIHQDKKGVWVYDEGSMRGAIGRPVDPKATEHPYKDLMPLGNSPYFHGMTAYDGGQLSWPGVTLRRERWYCIEQYVKMNTIDTKKFTPVDAFGNYSWDAANADGQMKAWVDGRLVVDHTGFRFARNPAIGLRGLDGNWYFGGRALSTSQQSYKWRDVVIATKYIGPRRETTSARRAKSLPLWIPRPGELKVIPTKNTFESQNPHIPEFASEFHRIVDDFSGGVYNPYWGSLGCMVFHGGGHAATNDNSVVILDYDDLTFKRLSKPSLKAGDVDNVSGEYSDGQPGAAHTYDALAIAPPSDDAPAGTLVTPMRMAIGYHASVDSDFAHHMTLAPGQERAHSARWRRLAKSDLAPLTPGGCCAYDTKRRRIWYTNAASQSHIRVIDLAKSAHQQIGIGKPTGETGPDAMTMRYDAQHDVLVLSAVREDGLARLMWLECATPSVGWRAAKISMDLPKHKYAASMPFDYVPELNRYVLLGAADREAVYEIEIPPNITELWRVTRRAFTGEVSIPVAYVSGKRWSYAPAAKAFLWLAAANGPLYSYRPYGT